MRSRTFRESYAAQSRLLPFADQWLWLAALVAALVALPFAANAYLLTIATTVLVACLGSLGLNLLTGVTGLGVGFNSDCAVFDRSS